MLPLQQKTALAATLCLSALLVGCPQPSKSDPPDKPGPTTRSAQTRPATTAPAIKPLPKQALVTLDKLTPKIDKPVNPAGAQDVPQRTAAAVAEAEVAIARKQYVAAISRLERAAGFAPGNPRVHRALGMAYTGLGNRGKALENLRKAVKGAPDDLQVQVLLGKLAAAQKQNASAIVSLRTALLCSEADQANPLVGEALLALGRLLAMEGYHTAALTSYDRLGRNIEKHRRHYASHLSLQSLVRRSETLLTWRGELLLKLRRPKQAAELLTKSRKHDRTSIETARLLLKALIEAKDVPGAVAVFHELAAETNMKGVAVELAGQLCRAAGDKTLPLTLWKEQRVKGQYDGALAVALAHTAKELGAGGDAMTILQELLSIVPDDVAAGRALVTIQVEQGKGAEALRVLGALLARGGTGLAGARAGLSELAGAKLPDDFERKFAAGIKAGKPLDRAALYYATGELARLRGKAALAADLLVKALEVKKDFLPAFEALADVYVADGRFDKVDELLKGLGDSPADQFRILVIRGKLQLARGMARQAIADLAKARELNGSDVGLLLLLARAHWQVDDFRDALLVLTAAQRAAPNEVRILRQQFRMCIEPVDGELILLSQAKMAAAKLAKLRPGSVEAGLMQAELALVEKKYIGAKGLVAKLKDQAPADRRVQMLAVRLDVDSRWEALSADERTALLRKARGFVMADPRDVQATRLLVAALAKAGKAGEVVSIWHLLHRKRPGDLRVTAVYADELEKAEKHSQAADVLAKVVDGDPENYFRLDKLIRLLITAKRHADAAARCEKAIKLTLPAQAARVFRNRLLGLYEETKAFDKAQKLLDDMIMTTGDDMRLATLRAQKIRFHGLAGQIDKAQKYALGWIEQEPNTLLPRTTLVDLLSDAKKWDQVLKLVNGWLKAKAGADDDDQVLQWCRHTKVRVHGLAGQIDEAQKCALEWIKKKPDAILPRALLVAVLSDAKQHDRAMKLVDGWVKARAGKKDDEILAWCRQTKVRLLMQTDKYAAALKQAEAYLQQTPKDPDLLALKSNCLTELGRSKEALAAMEKAYEEAPDDIQVNNNLAYVYAENGVKLDKAERMVRKALTERRDVVAYMDTLAWVFYKQGRIDAAVRRFELILKRDDLDEQGHPVIFDHAGDAFYRAGKPDRALKLWARAIERAKKESRVTSEVRKVLKGASQKIQAVRAGKTPVVAPLGQGVKDPAKAPAKPADKPDKAREAQPAEKTAPAR